MVGAATLRGRSSAWLERLPVTQEVASSTLVGPVPSENDYRDMKQITVIALRYRSLSFQETNVNNSIILFDNFRIVE